MTDITSVTRWPAAGQFWVWKSPLCLLRIEQACDEVGSDPDIVMATRWTPFAEEDASYVGFQPGNVEYLWCDAKHRHPPYPDGTPKLMPGDVLVREDGKLLFIGPETDKKIVHVLSTWRTSERDLTCAVYQWGPGHRAPKNKTAYNHIMDDKL